MKFNEKYKWQTKQESALNDNWWGNHSDRNQRRYEQRLMKNFSKIIVLDKFWWESLIHDERYHIYLEYIQSDKPIIDKKSFFENIKMKYPGKMDIRREKVLDLLLH